jgi:hypothetical protein
MAARLGKPRHGDKLACRQPFPVSRRHGAPFLPPHFILPKLSGLSDERSDRITDGPHSAGVLSPDGRWRWDGRARQVVPAPQKSRDVLVKLAAYAAFAGAGISLFNEVLTFVFIRAPWTCPTPNWPRHSNHPRHQAPWAGTLVLVEWDCIGPPPPSTISKIGLGTAIAGVTVVVLSSLVVLIKPEGNRSAATKSLRPTDRRCNMAGADKFEPEGGFLSKWLTLAGIASASEWHDQHRATTGALELASRRSALPPLA